MTTRQRRTHRSRGLGRRSLDDFLCHLLYRRFLGAHRGSGRLLRSRGRRFVDGLRRRRGLGLGYRDASVGAGQMPPDRQRGVIIKRTGMGLLLMKAELRKKLQDHIGLYFQLPRQLIDANFAHTF